jgi:hypothetical protein
MNRKMKATTNCAALRERLAKLLALSDRGVGGERENAQRFLDRELRRHGLTLEDIATEEKTPQRFSYKTELEKRLLIQVFASVLDTHEPGLYGYRGLKGCFADLSAAEFIEVDAAYRIYRKALRDDVKLLWRAFVEKNRIFPRTVAPDVSASEPQEEFDSDEYSRKLTMMAGVSVPSVRKALASGHTEVAAAKKRSRKSP